MSVQQGFRVNLTLCFSQLQVAAVYAATKGTRVPAYVSPFVGRLDDIGQNGMDVVKNAMRMLGGGDGHLLVLAASIRNLDQLHFCFSLNVDLVTVPGAVLKLWAEKRFPTPKADFQYHSSSKSVPYEELDLAQSWETFNIDHELTTKGLEKFAADYRKTLAGPAGSTEAP